MSTSYNKVNPDLIARLKKMDGYNRTALHSSMGEEMRNIIEERFDNSRDAFGYPFAQLKAYRYAAGTKKRKGGFFVGTVTSIRYKTRGPMDPPLKRRTLYKSFSYNATPAFVEIGTPISYAKYHTNFPNNNGAERKRIPRREFMGIFREHDFQRIQYAILDFFEAFLENKKAKAAA